MRELLSCGLCITLNSDDPSYFGAPLLPCLMVIEICCLSLLREFCSFLFMTHPKSCVAGGYIGANYAYVANALDLGHEELYQLACNGFEASFLGPEELAAYQQQLAAAYQEATGSAAPAQ